ncbi:MAG: mechanosensitive ion channel [Acidobacteriota bacterium]|nr:MAG: mechanosensitive ion channel [Acidobacteriota bacterium]
MSADFAELWRSPYLQALVLVLFAWPAARLFDFVLIRWVARLARKTKSELDDAILAVMHRPVMLIVVLLVVRAAVLRLGDRIHPVAVQYLEGGIYVIGVVVGVMLAHGLLRAVLDWYAAELARRTQSKVDDKFLPLLYKIGRIFVALTGAMVVLQHFHFNIASLVVSLGVGSLAVGLAAQDTIANIIAGFLIMLDKPFRIGDRIEFSDGTVGDVVDIGLRSTKIKNFDHNVIIVPNKDLVNERLVNYGYPDFVQTVRLRVGVAYGSDVAKVKRLLLECARQVESIDKEDEPVVRFIEFGDSSLNFLLLGKVRNYRDRFAAVDALHTLVDKRFAEEGIEIPFPHRTVLHRVEDAELEKLRKSDVKLPS